MELIWVLTPFPQNSDESTKGGLVCAYMHSTARNQKILMFMSSTGECRQQKHTQHAPFMKTECDYFNGWIKKMITCAEVSPKNGEPPRSNWERRRRRKRLRYQVCCASSLSVQHHIQLSKQFVCWLVGCLHIAAT